MVRWPGGQAPSALLMHVVSLRAHTGHMPAMTRAGKLHCKTCSPGCLAWRSERLCTCVPERSALCRHQRRFACLPFYTRERQVQELKSKARACEWPVLHVGMLLRLHAPCVSAEVDSVE